MLISDFDFQLPEELIAQEALPRGTSRMLELGPEEVRHRSIGDLPELLAAGDLLVLNDTRVIPARLLGRRRPHGGAVELLLVRRTDERQWLTLARPGRRAKPGTRLSLGPELEAEVLERADRGLYRVRFSQPVEPFLEEIGHVPLPPYIKRPDRQADRDRYQTVYARVPGAIAAPTAGLHFDDRLLERLGERGVATATLTLHVGIGTFKPVRAELVHEHRMDAEEVTIGDDAARAVRETRARGGRVVAVGTTVVRALEAAARRAGPELRPGRFETDLFIYPGFEFRLTDLLLTNFHLPRSTLLMLVCAFGGRRRVLAAYREAVRKRYRFYSYGDAMLVSPARDRLSGASAGAPGGS